MSNTNYICKQAEITGKYIDRIIGSTYENYINKINLLVKQLDFIEDKLKEIEEGVFKLPSAFVDVIGESIVDFNSTVQNMKNSQSCNGLFSLMSCGMNDYITLSKMYKSIESAENFTSDTFSKMTGYESKAKELVDTTIEQTRTSINDKIIRKLINEIQKLYNVPIPYGTGILSPILNTASGFKVNSYIQCIYTGSNNEDIILESPWSLDEYSLNGKIVIDGDYLEELATQVSNENSDSVFNKILSDIGGDANLTRKLIKSRIIDDFIERILKSVVTNWNKRFKNSKNEGTNIVSENGEPYLMGDSDYWNDSSPSYSKLEGKSPLHCNDYDNGTFNFNNTDSSENYILIDGTTEHANLDFLYSNIKNNYDGKYYPYKTDKIMLNKFGSNPQDLISSNNVSVKTTVGSSILFMRDIIGCVTDVCDSIDDFKYMGKDLMENLNGKIKEFNNENTWDSENKKYDGEKLTGRKLFKLKEEEITESSSKYQEKLDEEVNNKLEPNS